MKGWLADSLPPHHMYSNILDLFFGPGIVTLRGRHSVYQGGQRHTYVIHVYPLPPITGYQECYHGLKQKQKLTNIQEHQKLRLKSSSIIITIIITITCMISLCYLDPDLLQVEMCSTQVVQFSERADSQMMTHWNAKYMVLGLAPKMPLGICTYAYLASMPAALLSYLNLRSIYVHS